MAERAVPGPQGCELNKRVFSTIRGPFIETAKSVPALCLARRALMNRPAIKGSYSWRSIWTSEVPQMLAPCTSHFGSDAILLSPLEVQVESMHGYLE